MKVGLWTSRRSTRGGRVGTCQGPARGNKAPRAREPLPVLPPARPAVFPMCPAHPTRFAEGVFRRPPCGEHLDRAAGAPFAGSAAEWAGPGFRSRTPQGPIIAKLQEREGRGVRGIRRAGSSIDRAASRRHTSAISGASCASRSNGVAVCQRIAGLSLAPLLLAVMAQRRQQRGGCGGFSNCDLGAPSQ